MDSPPLSKEEIVDLLVKGSLQGFVWKNQLTKPGERFTFAQLFNLTNHDLRDYFTKNGFPPLNKKDGAKPLFIGDYETVWTYENWKYSALWLEKGTTSTLFSTHSWEEFQQWWNENLLKEYEFKLTYTWRNE